MDNLENVGNTIEDKWKETIENSIARLYINKNLSEEDAMMIIDCLRLLKLMDDKKERTRNIIQLLGAIQTYLLYDNIDKNSFMRISILYGGIIEFHNEMKREEKCLLDLGINKQFDFFFKLMSYLKKNPGVSQKDLLYEINISEDELVTFYFFQESINYIRRLGDGMKGVREEDYIYYITERGRTAYKNLIKERNKTKRINEEYDKYCSDNGYSDTKHIPSVKTKRHYKVGDNE